MRGATRVGDDPPDAEGISTHAPHAGSDEASIYLIATDMDFNPRSPCGERLEHSARHGIAVIISTHAPHAGSDSAAISGDWDGV